MAEPRKRKSAAARRAEIVDTAIRLSAEIGPDRVTTQQLADAVGVTQPAIFRHFATKSEIWDAVADHIVSEINGLHAQHLGAAANPHERLKHIVGHHMVHAANNPALPAILFSRELQAGNASLREKFSTVLAERRKALADVILDAQNAGLHRADLVAADAAHLVMAAIHGLWMRWALDNRNFDLVDEGGRLVGSLIDSFQA